MSKNTRALSHLSTSFNTVSLQPDHNHKSILSVFNDNTRNIEQMIYLKAELMTLQSGYSKFKADSQE
jgi:hypothetical protein